MIIDCISDLHGHYPKLEGGDLLIVAGDWTAHDTFDEVEQFEKDWLLFQDYKSIILVAGNHDNIAHRCGWESKGRVQYLCDSGTEFEGLKVWGSPWTLRFPGMNPQCMAFTCETEEELAEKFALIPDDVDILVTHSPPYGIKDKTVQGRFVGSQTLAYHIGSMQSPPKLWVWGHIHESYGRDMPIRGKPCIMVNASHVNERYDPVNKPIRIEL